MRKLYLLLIALIFSFTSTMAQGGRVVMPKSGGGAGGRNWGTANSWEGNIVPSNNDTVRVPAGHILSVNGNFTYTSLRIEIENGGLLILNNGGILMSATTGEVQVFDNGTLRSNVKTSADRIAINNVTKFDGSQTYSMNGNTTQGVVIGPAFADVTTGSGANGFTLGILPVTLTDFKATLNSNKVSLTWKTESESNSNEFVIERSKDGNSWNTIGKVQAAGNSSTKRSYVFADASPLTGLNIYRLKSVDLDNSFSYSAVRTVNVNSKAVTLQVFPNPAVSSVKVFVNDENRGTDVSVSIINKMGQVLVQRKLSADSNLLELSVKGFAEGNYLVQVISSNGWKETRSLVITGR